MVLLCYYCLRCSLTRVLWGSVTWLNTRSLRVRQLHACCFCVPLDSVRNSIKARALRPFLGPALDHELAKRAAHAWIVWHEGGALSLVRHLCIRVICDTRTQDRGFVFTAALKASSLPSLGRRYRVPIGRRRTKSAHSHHVANFDNCLGHPRDLAG